MHGRNAMRGARDSSLACDLEGSIPTVGTTITSLRARARSNHRPVQVRHLQQVGHPNLAYVNRVLQIAKAALLALKVAWIWIPIQVARLLGDQKALIAYLLATGELLGDLGRWEASHTYTAEAKRIAEQLGDSYEVAHAEFQLGCAYIEWGDCPEAEKRFMASIPELKRRGDSEHLAAALLLLARAVNCQTRAEEARAHWMEALQVAEAATDRRRAAIALVQLGNSLYREDNFEVAEAFWKRALAEYQALRDRRYQQEVNLSLGYAAFRLGRTDESQRLAMEARDFFRRIGKAELVASSEELMARLGRG